MKDKLMRSMAITVVVLLMTGCGNKIPQMTDEQQALVVEYAADVVVKHDKNYNGKLVKLSLEQQLSGDQEAVESYISENEMYSEPDVVESETVYNNEPDMIELEQPQITDIASFLQLSGVKIDYSGYEADDFYPNESESGSYYFVMNATQGNKLLVLKFIVENISGAEAELNIAQQHVRFKIGVNGEEKNALTTMLLNDLAFYQGVLAPGEQTELVLVCEIPEELAGTVPALTLIMKNVDNTATISLN